jgi:hypothetical protein
VVQQVAELVEQGLDLVVGQQRRAVADRRRQVAADQAEVRTEAAAPVGRRR